MSEVSMVGEKWPHKLHPGHTSCLMYVCYSFPTSFIVRKLYRSKVQWKSTPSNIPHSIFCTYFLRCDQYLGFLLDFTEASQCVCWYIYKWFSLGRIDWEVNGFNSQISFPREYDLARVVLQSKVFGCFEQKFRKVLVLKVFETQKHASQILQV